MNDSSNNPDRGKRPKSLWEVMGQPDADAPADDKVVPRQPQRGRPSEERTVPPVRLKSLWKIMRNRPPRPETDELTRETTASPLRDEETSAFDLIAEKLPTVDGAGLEAGPRKTSPRKTSPKTSPRRSPKAKSAAIPKLVLRHAPTAHVPPPAVRSRKAVWGAVAGVVAILSSFLALLPGMWAKLPALAVGFLALFAGFLAAEEIKTARGRKTGSKLAAAGIVLGICGMFLGPALSWTWGRFPIFASGNHLTTRRLETLGSALNRFHGAQGHFPPGGSFVALPGGGVQPMHGWMTSLLPYLGYDKLHRSINLSLAFDDPANRQPMREQVSEFLAAGVQQTTSVKGFGAAHFAGVGGETTDARGRRIHFGIFDRNSRTQQKDIRDGLSNTLIAGEIPGAFPAWGEPENWRQIGKGLNREMRGFGNAGSGPTLFLNADGSVRNFATNTDPEVLRKLSTRDGGE